MKIDILLKKKTCRLVSNQEDMKWYWPCATLYQWERGLVNIFLNYVLWAEPVGISRFNEKQPQRITHQYGIFNTFFMGYIFLMLYSWDTYIIKNRAINLMSRVFANGSGDRGSIPGRVIRKTQKMVLVAP